jgi:hypothetical protein
MLEFTDKHYKSKMLDWMFSEGISLSLMWGPEQQCAFYTDKEVGVTNSDRRGKGNPSIHENTK